MTTPNGRGVPWWTYFLLLAVVVPLFALGFQEFSPPAAGAAGVYGTYPSCSDNQTKYGKDEIELTIYDDCRSEWVNLPYDWRVQVPDPDKPGRFISKYRYRGTPVVEKGFELCYQDGRCFTIDRPNKPAWYEGYPVFSIRSLQGKNTIIIRRMDNADVKVDHPSD